ncbi:receptor activity-modifying protein 1-like [Alligator sinensis]|uniref:Receptor activity-modifying protein 1-like n=1 Tax=Alligator sinensis TaxID=38654 RepID=A0A3Q0GAN6_ALLSI|nr:receptor activity-modifying protein 1-like [Alligator sinensis]
MTFQACRQLCCFLLLSLLQWGLSELTYGDLEDESHYIYLDEDSPFAELDGLAHCRSTYQDWISLYCWTTFHATVMAMPDGSQCQWDQISSAYSNLANCTELLAEALACPWPSPTLDSFFLQIHMEYFPNCTAAESSGPLEPPVRPIHALATLSICLTPLAVALTLRKTRRAEPEP